MCIVVDANTFSKVFNPSDKEHVEFEPVYIWITKKKGKLVFGGSKYAQELRDANKYHKLFNILKDMGKVVEVDAADVDSYEKVLIKKLKHRDFDDPHLIAISVISGCLLICTNEKKAIKFIKMKTLYPKGHKRPSIYSCSGNKDILCDSYYANICK